MQNYTFKIMCPVLNGTYQFQGKKVTNDSLAKKHSIIVNIVLE